MKRPTRKYRKPGRFHRGRWPVALICLAGLLGLSIVNPDATRYSAMAALVILIWSLWRRPEPAGPEKREPSLWDDGFGAT